MENLSKNQRVVLLNTSILTTKGTFSYEEISEQRVKELLSSSSEILSAIGHASTAQIMTELTGHQVDVNRVMYEQELRDTAIVFKLLGRPKEGVILSKEEIEVIGYEWGELKLITKG